MTQSIKFASENDKLDLAVSCEIRTRCIGNEANVFNWQLNRDLNSRHLSEQSVKEIRSTKIRSSLAVATIMLHSSSHRIVYGTRTTDSENERQKYEKIHKNKFGGISSWHGAHFCRLRLWHWRGLGDYRL